MILVSSCLLNYPVRYKGDGNPVPLLIKYADCGHFLPFCPECAGNLPTPRPPAEINGGTGKEVWNNSAQVINNENINVTENFKSGAKKALLILKNTPITAVILKERSPSCGTKHIYDGTFQGKIIDGMGVTAALLAQENLPLYSEEDLTEELLQKLIAQDRK